MKKKYLHGQAHLRGQGLSCGDQAQGTIEYLVIIGIIVVISLIVVSIVITSSDSASAVSNNFSNISNKVGSGGISVVEGAVDLDGNTIIFLQNLSGENFFVVGVTSLDDAGNEGNSEMKDNSFFNSEIVSLTFAENELCKCLPEEKEKLCNYKLTLQYSESSFEKEVSVQALINCVSSITIPFVPEPSVEFVASCWSDEINPHPICNCFDLNQIREHLDWSYAVQNDISMNVNECATFQSGTGFEPIGNCGGDNCYPYSNPNNPFLGSFNGNNYAISNLMINLPSSDNVGLFGYISSGEIINVDLINVSITGYSNVGGLVGYTDDGSIISDSYSNGSVTGESLVGGLVGEDMGATITNSYSTATISGSSYVGGLVGDLAAGLIENSYSTGSITGGSSVGGLVGYQYGGSIINSYSTATISGFSYVGGLVGYTPESLYAGSPTISNSYSIGAVSGSSYVGGLVGYSFDVLSNSSFWDVNTSGVGVSGEDNFGAIGKTTAEMKSSITYDGWDFITIWDINNSYPSLRGIN